jgi:hypothetical protein
MYVEISRDGEPKSAHFGVSDLVLDGLSVELFYFGVEESAEYEGFVSAAAAGSTFNKISAREAIADDALNKNISVVVAESGHNPEIIEAARELKNDDEFDGELKLLS